MTFQLYNELDKGANKDKIEKPKEDDIANGFAKLLRDASLQVMLIMFSIIVNY